MTDREVTPELWEKNHDQEWWKVWWAEDYSWDGLANKDWGGYSVTPDGTLVSSAIAPARSREATLQDYWRDEEQNLISETERNGRVVRRWTRFHLPTEFQDGSPTGKGAWDDAQWSSIEDALKTLLTRAKKNPTLGKEDNRVQFRGVIVRKLPGLSEAPLHLRADTARFLGDCDFSEYVFGPDLDLQWATFAGSTSWKRTKFEGSTNFGSAQFCGRASFEATFSGHAWFLGTQFGGQKVSFAGTTFSGASFSNAHFFSAVGFTSAKLKDADFSNARFWNSASFDSAEIIGTANFTGTKFGRENGTGAESTFAKTIFSGPALFDGAIFYSETIFTAAQFDDKEHLVSKSIKKLERFEGSKLLFDVHFDGTEFHRKVNFENAVFSTDVTFDDAIFAGKVEFDCATFSGVTSFESTRLDGSPRVSFQSANFVRPARFEKTRWPIDPRAHAGAFRDVKFSRLVEFSQDDSFPFTAFAMFDGTKFEGEVRFSREIMRGDCGMKAAFSAARGNDDLLRALENGCRAIKLGSENSSDRLAEQSFYRYELTCRQDQTTTDRQERVVSRLYNVVSSYGTSMVRPLGILAGVWLTFSVVYWTIALLIPRSPIHGLTFRPFAPVHDSLIDTLRLSAHVIFAPFAIWGGSFAVTDFDSSLLNAGPAVALIVRLVATLESILAGVLVFLSLLSLRRRFKID